MRSEKAFTVVELVVTLGLISILAGMALMNLKELDDPLKNGSAELTSFFKQVRSRAISTTSAYTVSASSSTLLVTEFGNTCSDVDTTEDDTLTLQLPTGSSLVDTGWTLCFNGRGLPDGNLQVDMNDADGDTRTVEVYLGGGVRVQ